MQQHLASRNNNDKGNNNNNNNETDLPRPHRLGLGAIPKLDKSNDWMERDIVVTVIVNKS